MIRQPGRDSDSPLPLPKSTGQRKTSKHRTFAVTGADGVRLAQELAPDLILVDINLPDFDGYEVTRRIRRLDPAGKVPIVAITSNAMTGDREKSLDAGCDDYDTKPVEFQRLLGKINTLLKR